MLATVSPSAAETLADALVRTYQTNPALNAERARQRGTDENVPQALAGYRPQLVASLSSGLQAVRNILPDNTVQSATLKPWTIGLTVTQILFNGYKTSNNVRVAEFQVKSGREALRNIEQGVLLDAVTAYMNVMANYALLEAQKTNVQVLREIQATTKRRLDAGDVTPTDTAQAEARLSRGLADLNAAEVGLAISKEIYKQVIGDPPGAARCDESGRSPDPDRVKAAPLNSPPTSIPRCWALPTMSMSPPSRSSSRKARCCRRSRFRAA